MTYMVYVYDYAHDINHPLYTSDGEIYLAPNGLEATTVNVPTDQETQRRFWVIGCFKGSEGLQGIKIVNNLVELVPTSHPEYCEF